MIQGTGTELPHPDFTTIMMVHSANFFNYINLAQADNSGMLRFLTDELQDAEDKGDRGVLLMTS